MASHKVSANTYESAMGTERMGKLLLRMSLPQIAAQLVNLFYNMVDRMYIGHIPQSGPDALAG
ncbi:MAG: hypothetical protein IJ865_10060, partial [Clostridia bacterium]|nr:hypothetical protein [Clostridia bacterium]